MYLESKNAEGSHVRLVVAKIKDLNLKEIKDGLVMVELETLMEDGQQKLLYLPMEKMYQLELVIEGDRTVRLRLYKDIVIEIGRI